MRREDNAYDGPTVIDGRPDLQGGAGGRYGITVAKKFPPYVFSTRGGSLVHKVAYVELWWWDVGRNGHTLVRRVSPRMHAHTVCGMTFFLRATRNRTCQVPSPEALLCGRCHGEPATFGPYGEGTRDGWTRKSASVKLGCVVNGY